MNKNFALVLSCAVSILGLASCNNKEADMLKPNDKTHTVVFQAQNPAASETKTSLRLEVVPDWRETDVNDVHIFETETVGETVTTTEATHVSMKIVDEKKSDARFTAEFANATVIVDPPKATKASTSSSYQYTAIMATRDGDKYVVPSVQYPHEVAWIDPKADMLVGRNETIFPKWIDEDQELGLEFERPVALARLAITNLEGAKVTMVKITTVNNITGYLTYGDVDFDNKKEQEFLSDDSDKVLTLLYPGEGKTRTTTFYAYFVCVPHGVQFSKIEVYTDQYVFTKEYSTPPTLTFTAGDFMNIALDMTPKEGNGVTKTGLGTQTLSFVDGDSQPVTEAKYDLYSADPFVAPTLVIGDNVVDPTKVEVSSDKEEVAIASYANDVVSVSFPGKTGVATITATVPGDETHAAGTASFKLTVVDSTPKTAQEIAFAKEAVDYDLYGGTGKLTLPAWAENKDPKTTVTYASNSEVITVDETSGEVTIGATAKVGDTAVITATAAEDDTYQQATATCTITIVDTTPAQATHHYEKVTSISGLVADGKYLFVYEDGANSLAFKPVLNSEKNRFETTNNTQAVTLMGGTWIASSEELDACVIIPEEADDKSTTKFHLFVPGVSEGATKYYFVPRMDNVNPAVNFDAVADPDCRATFAIANGVLTLNRSSYYFYLVSGAFNMQSSNPSNSKLALYKYVEGEDPAPVAQTLSFSPESYSVAVNATKIVPPTLSGANTTVTYSITGNTSVATVDPATGDLTLLAEGTTEVTATAAAENGYAEASKSYTLTVTEAAQMATYIKVTSTADLEADAKYILVYESASAAFKPILNGSSFSKSTANVLSVEIVNNTISSSELDNCQITFEEGKYLWIESAGKYLYPGASGDNALGAEDKNTSHIVSVSITNGIANISRTNDASYHLYWSTKNNYFSGVNSTDSSSYPDNLCLYMLDDGLTKQTLTFSGSEAVYDLGTNAWTTAVPTLSGAQTSPLSWTSSDDNIASVDGSGNVTAKAVGTATIKVKAPKNETYKSGSASFTVTVFNSSLPKYVKATEAENGEEYLVVSNGYALKNNSSTAAAEAVSVINGAIYYNAPASVLWTATESSGKFTFKNDTRYMYRSSSNFSLSTSSSTWSYNATDKYLTTSGSSTYYFYYSTNSNAFSVSTTKNDAHTAALYVLDGPKDRNLAFSASSKSVNVYGKTESYVLTDAPTLSGKAGALDDVTYSVTGDENVASVASDGKVTLLLGTGTVTVKASANKTDKWLAGEASYTLTVTNTAPPTYTKVDEITSGATYLIVSTDANNYNGLGQKRAFAGDTTGSAVEVDGTSGTITGDFSAAEFVITKEGDDYVLNGPNGYVTGQSSSDPYIQVSSSKVTMSLTDAATLKAASSDDGKVSDAFYFYYLKDSSKEALYLNSNKKFKMGGSGRKYGVYLYKKN